MTDTHAKRVAVLTAAAKAKSEAKTRAAEQGIRAMVKRGEPITFQAVQRKAGVSHAFLFNHPELRGRIEHLRARARPNPTPPAPPDSESALVLALTAQINELQRRHRHDVQTLRNALEQATARTSTCEESSPAEEPAPATTHPRCIDRKNDVMR